MSELVKITDHDAQTKGLLKFQFKDQADILKFVSCLTRQIQEVENCLFDLKTLRFLAYAIGVQLDQIGIIVGLERAGLDDSTYRYRLYFKIGENVSQGTYEDLINVLRILTNSTIVIITEYFPASVVVSNSQPIPADLQAIITPEMQKIVPAGVKFIYLSTFDESESFAYEGAPDAGAKGYDDGSGTMGGKYAAISS